MQWTAITPSLRGRKRDGRDGAVGRRGEMKSESLKRSLTKPVDPISRVPNWSMRHDFHRLNLALFSEGRSRPTRNLNQPSAHGATAFGLRAREFASQRPPRHPPLLRAGGPPVLPSWRASRRCVGMLLGARGRWRGRRPSCARACQCCGPGTPPFPSGEGGPREPTLMLTGKLTRRIGPGRSLGAMEEPRPTGCSCGGRRYGVGVRSVHLSGFRISVVCGRGFLRPAGRTEGAPPPRPRPSQCRLRGELCARRARSPAGAGWAFVDLYPPLGRTGWNNAFGGGSGPPPHCRRPSPAVGAPVGIVTT